MKSPQQYIASIIQKQVEKQIKPIKPGVKKKKSSKKKTYTAKIQGAFVLELKLMKKKKKQSSKKVGKSKIKQMITQKGGM